MISILTPPLLWQFARTEQSVAAIHYRENQPDVLMHLSSFRVVTLVTRGMRKFSAMRAGTTRASTEVLVRLADPDAARSHAGSLEE
jgi:hypothetical protein